MKKLDYKHIDTDGHNWYFYNTNTTQDLIVAISYTKMSCLLCTEDKLEKGERVKSLIARIDR